MKIIILIISLILVVIIITGIYFLNYSTNPRFSLKRLFKKKNMNFLSSSKDLDWFNKCPHKEVYVLSFDKKKLHAYELKNKSNTWIIMVHGYTNNALEILSIAKEFYDKGYSLLIIDQRAHGKSEGKYSTLGYLERRDILTWIEYINKKKKALIVLYGLSMGGTVIMQTVGLNLPNSVICAIEDCGFISNYCQYYEQLSYRHLPAKFIIFSFNIFSMLLMGFNIYKFNPYKELEKGQIPMLFIHGKSDKLVKPENAQKAYELYHGGKEILLIDKAKHMKSSLASPLLYYQKIFSFIEKNKHKNIK